MLQYSAIGDVVNVASRMEQANKEFSTDICFSHEIYINLKKQLHDKSKLSGEIKLKGALEILHLLESEGKLTLIAR